MSGSVSPFFLSAALLAGCASDPMDYKSGSRIGSNQLARFSSGKTLQLDVVSAIGYPSDTDSLNGNERWYYISSASGSDSGNRRRATVFEWDINGVLVKTYRVNRVSNNSKKS